MAAFRDDMPLIVGVNEDWDENTTRAQIGRPVWDFSPLRMKTMHHLPHIFFDTLRPERPDCPVLVPSSFSVSRDKVIARTFTVMNHAVYQQATLCQPKKHRYA